MRVQIIVEWSSYFFLALKPVIMSFADFVFVESESGCCSDVFRPNQRSSQIVLRGPFYVGIYWR